MYGMNKNILNLILNILSVKKEATMKKSLGIGLMVFLMSIVLAISAFGADRLIVQDQNANTKFMVTDQGAMGIGTTTPDTLIHVKKDQSGLTSLRVENANILGAADPLAQEQFVLGPNHFEHLMLQVLSDSHATLPRVALINAYTHDFYLRTNAVSVFKMFRVGGTENTLVLKNGYVGIGTVNPAYPLHMASGARCTTGGAWTNASSREYKENIADLSVDQALLAFNKLNPVTFSYKVETGEKHVGFIAEDVPDLVATPDRKALSTMDIVAVLTKVVQEQQKVIAGLNEKVTRLEQQVK